jgi:hypothetical protein
MTRVSVTRNPAELPANERVSARRAPVSKRARQAFLDLVATGYSVSAAAQRLGLHRQRLYELRDRDAVFRQDWQQAVEAGTDLLEQTAWEIATKGALEETFDESGRLVSSRRKQDPATVRFLLASRRPEQYSERQRLEIGGRVDVEHQLAVGPVITIDDVLAMHKQKELEPAGEVVDVEDEPAGDGAA